MDRYIININMNVSDDCYKPISLFTCEACKKFEEANNFAFVCFYASSYITNKLFRECARNNKDCEKCTYKSRCEKLYKSMFHSEIDLKYEDQKDLVINHHPINGSKKVQKVRF